MADGEGGSGSRTGQPLGGGRAPGALICSLTPEWGWRTWASPAPCFTHLVPGPLQVEELGCLEVEAEAKMENSQEAVPGQPLAPVSWAPAQGFSGWVLAGHVLLLRPGSAFPLSSQGFGQTLSPQGQLGSASLPPVSICGPVTPPLNPTARVSATAQQSRRCCRYHARPAHSQISAGPEDPVREALAGTGGESKRKPNAGRLGAGALGLFQNRAEGLGSSRLSRGKQYRYPRTQARERCTPQRWE